jgi:hypothetical protein
MSFASGSLIEQLTEIVGPKTAQIIGNLSPVDLAMLELNPEFGIPLLLAGLTFTAVEASGIADLLKEHSTNKPDGHASIDRAFGFNDPSINRHAPVIDRFDNEEKTSLLPDSQTARIINDPDSSGLVNIRGDISGQGSSSVTTSSGTALPASASSIPASASSSQSSAQSSSSTTTTMTIPNLQDVDLQPAIRQRIQDITETTPLINRNIERIMNMNDADDTDIPRVTPYKVGFYIYTLIASGMGIINIIKQIKEMMGTDDDTARRIIDHITTPEQKKNIAKNDRSINIDDKVSSMLGVKPKQRIDMKDYKLPDTTQSYNNVELVRRSNANYIMARNIF